MSRPPVPQRLPAMLFHEWFSTVPADQVQELVRQATLGRLITVSADGVPHLGLYPFVHAGADIELHLATGDEQLADLAASPRCLFEVDETLATIPSYWEHPRHATGADAYYRAVLFDADASLDHGDEPLTRHLTALLHRYQPEGGYAALDEAPDHYAPYLGRLVLVRLRLTRTRVKFKLGQQLAPETRADVIAALRKRGRDLDRRTARAMGGE